MGTKADFYVGRGVAAEWLGSIRLDGYPEGLEDQVLMCSTEQEFRAAVSTYIATRHDWLKPDDGWPWPWDDSLTTDYSYAFDNGRVWATQWGDFWFNPTEECLDGEALGIQIPLTREVAFALWQHALAAGKDIETYVLEVIHKNVGMFPSQELFGPKQCVFPNMSNRRGDWSK